MKLLAVLLVVFVVMALIFVKISGTARAEDQPPLKAKSTLDMGTVFAPKKIPFDIVLQNTSSQPEKIVDIKPSCGCTMIKDDNFIIPPFSDHTVPILYDTYGKMGRQNVKVRVQIKGYQQPKVFSVSASVDVQYPDDLWLPATRSDDLKDTTFLIKNGQVKHLLIINSMHFDKNLIEVKLTRTAQDGDTIAIRPAVGAKEGNFTTPLSIITNEADSPLKSIIVHGQIFSDVISDPSQISVGVLQPKEVFAEVIHLRSPYGNAFKVQSVKSDPEIVKVSFDPALKSTDHTINVTVRSQKGGRDLNTYVLFNTSDSAQRQVRVKLFGIVANV